MADTGPNDLERQVAALEQGRAFLDLAGWNLTEVGGSDAEGWLNDLITTSTEALAEGEARRSLLSTKETMVQVFRQTRFLQK